MTGDPPHASDRRPRLGFLGVGWIGLNRLQAIAGSGAATVAAIADPQPNAVADAAHSAPGAVLGASLDDLLAADLDGVVIATPSALHAEQATAALAHGLAVFCQKPLARNGAEARAVVAAARAADRLLHVDLSYRHLAAVTALAAEVRSGALGEIYAIDAVFHNAYGPNNAWCQDRRLAGGGCLIDLGVHMVDLALWLLDFPRVEQVTSRIHARGRRWHAGDEAVEDHVTSRLDLEGGAAVTLSCSWHLPLGRDCAIRLACFGTRGGAAIENVNGSFHDFRAERYDAQTTTLLAAPPDQWSGRAAVAWALQLGRDPRFDPAAERFAQVAAVLDEVYAS